MNNKRRKECNKGKGKGKAINDSQKLLNFIHILVIFVSPANGLSAMIHHLNIILRLSQFVIQFTRFYNLQILQKDHIMFLYILCAFLASKQGCNYFPALWVFLINHSQSQLKQLVLLPTPSTQQLRKNIHVHDVHVSRAAEQSREERTRSHSFDQFEENKDHQTQQMGLRDNIIRKSTCLCGASPVLDEGEKMMNDKGVTYHTKL